MVVRMAMSMWRGSIKLNVLVEYGMFVLRIAAQSPRPSRTKKGEIVGFDPGKGNFSAYARNYAKKEMQTPEEIISLGEEARDFGRVCRVLKAVTR